MKGASAAYVAERVKLQTQPRYFARFFAIPSFASGVDYAFSRDFSTGVVLSPTKTKLSALLNISGLSQSISPELGQSTIGQFTLTFQDRSGEILRQMGQRVLSLAGPTTASIPPTGGYLSVSEDPTGFPALGTLDVYTNGVLERIRYDAFDVPLRRFGPIQRGADGTAAIAHVVGDKVQNGEQLRPGTRVQLYAGYAGLLESDYMPYIKMLVVGREVGADGLTVIVRVADMQRSTRQTVFLAASQDAPVIITGNPLTILLQVLLSTGAGTNGPYDVLAAGNGLKVPQAFVDVTGIEALRAAEFPSDSYTFSMVSPQDGKQFVEREICQTLNCYPLVTQDGKLTLKRYKTYSPSSAIAATLTEQDVITWGWNAGDSNIINIVEFDYDFNVNAGAPGEFGYKQVYTKNASFDRYGARPRLLIQSMGIRKASSAQSILDNRAFEVFRRFSEPPQMLTLHVLFRNHLLEPGDLVQITHPRILNTNTGLRGLTGEVFEVVNMSPGFDAGFVTLQLLWVSSINPITAPTSGGEISLLPVSQVRVTEFWEEFIAQLGVDVPSSSVMYPSGWWRGLGGNTSQGSLATGSVFRRGTTGVASSTSLYRDQALSITGAMVKMANNPALHWRWALLGTSTTIRKVGWAEGNNNLGVGMGIWCEHDGPGTPIICKSQGPLGPDLTTITTSVLVAVGVFHTAKAVVTGGGTALEFFIDDVSVGTVPTASIPTFTLSPSMLTGVSTTADGTEIDYFGMTVPR